jgi:carboxyl-terminal processing protease
MKEALEELKTRTEHRSWFARSQTGGLLNEAVKFVICLYRNEVIVTTKSKIQKHNTTYKTEFEPIDTTIP